MQANSPLIALSSSSPSFNSYSSGKLAEIAARVVQEFSNDFHSQDLDYDIPQHFLPPLPLEDQEMKNHQEEVDDEEEEFEFAVVCRETVESPISADDIFYNGQIRPIYPLFNTSLLLQDRDEQSSKPATPAKPTRLPLRKLFSEEERESCSSSEADDIESLPPETYCVWTPKKTPSKDQEAKSGGDICKKSSSTGTASKRWKFRDLLYRSNSDGKDTFVFLTPAKKSGDRRVNAEEKNNNNSKEGKTDGDGVEEHRHYAKSKAVKEGDKRRSFLPYKHDLVGFFSNVNGLSRNLHPF